MLKRFFKDSFIYGVAGLLSRSISIITLPLYTKVFSPVDFGVIDLGLIFAVFAGVIIPLGISSGVARYFPEAQSENEKETLASSGLWFVILTHTLFMAFCIYFADAMTILLFGSIQWSLAYHLCLIAILSNGIFYYFQNLLRWKLEPKAYVFCSLISILINVSTAILAIFVINAGVSGIFIGQIAGGIIGGLASWYASKELFKLTLSTSRLKEMLLFSIPLVPTLLGEFIMNYIDRMSIRTLLSVEDLGLYGVGFRFASIISLVMVGFSSSLTPLVYANYKKDTTRAELARIFRFFLVIALPSLLLLMLFSKEILRAFASPEYYSVWLVVAILSPGLLLMTMYNFAPGIDIEKKTKVTALIQISAAAINACLNLYLIPMMGIAGSAIATLLTGSFLFAAYMYYSQKYYFVPHHWRRLFGAVCIVAAAIVLAIMFPTDGMSLNHALFKVGILFIAVLGIGVVLLDRNEITFITVKVRNFFIKDRI